MPHTSPAISAGAGARDFALWSRGEGRTCERMLSRHARRIRDICLYQAVRFFPLGGTREKAARGFAIRLACCLYPTFGLGGFLGGFLAGLCRSSMVAGVVGGT